MIAYIKGKIIKKGKGYSVVVANNVGYKIYASELLYSDLPLGSEAEFYIYERIKEDAYDLYGFKTDEELELFELLLTVSGIGPKTALGIVSGASANDIKKAINKEDAALLAKMCGVSVKIAERVALELGGKIKKIMKNNITADEEETSDTTMDEIDALTSLGYSDRQAREALRQVDAKITDSSERVKKALKNIK
ncbi:MAG: Holliday junction branch migration protein RuvA [bacterium]